ncbi:MAG: hypothetical protein IJ622_12130 [Bacteroidales bacterium]|nr:hypothetical protein [Bacteroidales bacterium]
MKHKDLLLITLLLSITTFAQQETKNEPASRRVNNTLGVCMMGKTMLCNGINMSYIASEQGKMSFAYGLEYDREYMLGKTPLGILTGVRFEYSRPYAKFEEDGQILELKAHDLTGVLPVMLQYHDKLGDRTELQLFTGPSLDLVLYRKTDASGIVSGSGSYIFGSPLENSGKPTWHWMGLSWNFGIGIQYNDICFKISSSYGLLNHFDKDYTAQYLGYPLRINRPIVGTVLFKL